MTEAQARARLQRMVQDAVDPVLSSAEVDDLLALARRSDAEGNLAYPAWSPSTAYPVGAYVVPNPRNGHFYKATSSGTSGGSQPSFGTTSGGTTSDGSVTWTEAGIDNWTATWDLNAAAAEGWRWKAGKVAPAYGFQLDSQIANRQQVYEHCLSQAESYARKVLGSLPLSRSTFPFARVSANV